MAIDKAIDSSQLDTDLTSVANAIRTKGGTSASLAFPAGFVTAIQNIPSGGNPPYTELSAVSVLQNSTVGWQNRINLRPHTDIKRIEISYKKLGSQTRAIVFSRGTLSASSYPGAEAPYISTDGQSGATINSSTVVDGYTQVDATFGTAISNTKFGLFGCWGSGYSDTMAYKYLKVYNSDGTKTHDLIPVLDKNNEACFYDLVNETFCYLNTGREMVSGEAVV